MLDHIPAGTALQYLGRTKAQNNENQQDSILGRLVPHLGTEYGVLHGGYYSSLLQHHKP